MLRMRHTDNNCISTIIILFQLSQQSSHLVGYVLHVNHVWLLLFYKITILWYRFCLKCFANAYQKKKIMNQCKPITNSKISFVHSTLGTHGSPRRRNNGHDPPVKHLGLGEVKRFIGGMHNTEPLPGKHHIRRIKNNNLSIGFMWNVTHTHRQKTSIQLLEVRVREILCI